MVANDEEHQKYIQIWSRVVETQMHFNEMQVKSRQLGLTFVTAALGVAIVLLSSGDDFAFDIQVFGVQVRVHVSVLIVLGSLLALNAVKQLDLNVYHRMLRGAVTFGEDFEANYMKKIFDLQKGMTEAISHYSRFEDAGKEIGSDGKYEYTGDQGVTAHQKIKVFYRNTSWFLLLSALLLFMFINFAQVSDAGLGELAIENTDVSLLNEEALTE